jgi:hypothetical protein
MRKASRVRCRSEIGESAKLYFAAILDLYSRFVIGWRSVP